MIGLKMRPDYSLKAVFSRTGSSDEKKASDSLKNRLLHLMTNTQPCTSTVLNILYKCVLLSPLYTFWVDLTTVPLAK